jgi:hypothetical protein
LIVHRCSVWHLIPESQHERKHDLAQWPFPCGRPDAAAGVRHHHRGPATPLIDLAGRTVIPGLNDSHLQLIRGGLNYKRELRREGVQAHAHDRARKSAVPISDFSGFWGTLGCSCFAF